MAADCQQPKGRDGALSMLNAAIEALNLAKEISSVTPAKAVFGSVSVLLTMIRDSMANDQDYVDLGLSCADICRALGRGMDGKRLGDLSQSVREAMEQLTTTVAEVQKKVIKQSQRNSVSRILRAKNDRDTIASWRLELNRILHVFNTELAVNTNLAVSGIRDDVSKIRQEIGAQVRSAQTSTLGESPPPAPRACFGRDELIEKIIGLAEALTPVALIGSGGIGKTSIALTVLHHDRIKERFGDNRRFIRCDQFPASPANFLRRLSKVIGADVENSEDLIPLRPFLTSKEMLIVLDNAESILDPQGASGREINVFVEELSQINNICLCITSRITTVPPDCKTLEIPTLSMEAARDTFYRIYEYGGQSDSTNDILEQLDFHPLSVTLLATVAHQNKWDGNRLAKEWKQRQTGVLQTGYNKSLACAIELSLASPMFRELGPDARGLLGVAAFFPQGIDENNLDWLFPTISNRTAIFDTFCVLSLTYRNNEFVTMLAPLRDLLRPQDPMSSSLLCATKNRYFARMLIDFDRNSPVFKESQWIILEDVNVEHLLDVFTSVDGNSYEVWEACADFTNHIYWHKPRPTVLRQKMEGLPDDHPSKLGCLVELAKLFHSIGNNMERKRLLNHVLELQRGGDDENAVAYTLSSLSDANRTLGFYKEGIQQAREGFEIYQRVGTKAHQAGCLNYLALLLYADERPGEAKEAAFHVVGLLEEGEEYMACQSQRLLGDIYRFDGEREKAIHHLEVALRIASPFNWHNQLSHIHYALGWLFLDQGEFGNAHTHVEQAKLYAVENAYSLGRAMALEAQVWHRQGRLEEAGCEALRASEIFEKLGATEESNSCRGLLRYIEQAMEGQSASENLNPNVHGSPSNAPAKFRFSRRFNFF